MIEVLLLLLPISTTMSTSMYSYMVLIMEIEISPTILNGTQFRKAYDYTDGIPWIILWHGKDSVVTGNHGYTAALHHLTSQSC